MTDRRAPRPAWRAWPACLAGWLLLTGGLSSCVYFNTYYNAERYFRQAEKARARAEARESGTAPQARRGRGSRGANYVDLYDKAVRKASIVLEKYPESERVDDAMFLAGRALFWQQDYQYGARSFSDLEEHFPNSEYVDRARLWRARCLEEMGSEAEARALYTALVLERSDVGDRAGLRLGEMALADGDERAAIEEFRATLAAFPDSRREAQLWLRVGDAHLMLEGEAHLDSALASFDRSLRASPADSVEYRARLNRGRVLYRQGRPEQALATYQELLRQGRFRTWEGETRILIGQYYRERGSLAAALEEFGRVRDDFPGTDISALALYETGLLYLQEHGERRRAEEYFEEVGLEKRGSTADSLARVMLTTTSKLDELLEDIYASDSTAAALQLRAHAAATGGAAAVRSGARDPTAARTDTTASRPADSDSAATAGVAPSAAHSLASAAHDTAPSAVDSLVSASATDAATVADSVASATAAVAPPADSLASGLAATSPAPMPRMPEALRGYVAAIDSQGHWVPLVARPEEEEEEGESGQGTSRSRRRSGSRQQAGGRAPTLQDNLFAAADLYRDELGLPDSAAVLYAAVADRYPGDGQVPRALYNLAWTHLEFRAEREAAVPVLERLVAEHPATEHANAARRQLGQPEERSAEDEARAAFADIERVRLQSPDEPDRWLPQLDALAAAYAGTVVAARAAYLAAWATENVVGDSAAAAARYDSVRDAYRGNPVAMLLEDRRRAERDGAVDKLERELKALGRGAGPGERLVVIAAEPTREDTTELSRKYLGFGMRALRRGDLTGAEELFQLSLDEQESRNGEALLGLGEISWRQGYVADAVDNLRAALKARVNSSLPHYRLFAYHVSEGQADSANNYLRTIARRDRETPAVGDLVIRFPTIATAEPETIELEELESVDLEPDDSVFELSPGFFGIVEPPLVRSSRKPEYPPGQTDSVTVVIDALVASGGRADQVLVHAGDEPFATAARQAVESYTFYAGEGPNERSVSVWVEVEIPVAPAAARVAAADSLPGVRGAPPPRAVPAPEPRVRTPSAPEEAAPDAAQDDAAVDGAADDGEDVAVDDDPPTADAEADQSEGSVPP